MRSRFSIKSDELMTRSQKVMFSAYIYMFFVVVRSYMFNKDLIFMKKSILFLLYREWVTKQKFSFHDVGPELKSFDNFDSWNLEIMMLKKPFLEISHMLSKKPAVANLHRIFSCAPPHWNQTFFYFMDLYKLKGLG